VRTRLHFALAVLWLECTKSVFCMQFDNAWEGNWLSFCAAREVANAMIADPNKGTLLVHNGDISYAQCVTAPPLSRYCTPHAPTAPPLVLIGLLYKAYRDDCQHRLDVLLRQRPCPMRGHRLLCTPLVSVHPPCISAPPLHQCTPLALLHPPCITAPPLRP